ncbi:MAG: PEP-CTERM sorting domain-containing protein [Phycisphaerales bacterium]|nr:PEP-CTERM sorting domain-containing protein [Phycisphaerales bacterium]
MRNRNSLLAAAVVAGLGLAGSAMAATLDGTLDSSLFTSKYEGDVLPQNAGLGFTLTDPNGVYGTASDPASLGSGNGVNYLTINTDTNTTVVANQYGDVYHYSVGGASSSWTPNFLGGFTIEMRAIVHPSNSATYGAGLQGQDVNSTGLFQFFYNKIIVELGTISGMDNSDTWHTFRIASYSPNDSSTGQIYQLWRDGVDLGSIAQNTSFPNPPKLYIGDFISGSAEVNLDVDYLRWTTDGAFAPAPVPEPSTTMGLLLAGSGMMLRRRKGFVRQD